MAQKTRATHMSGTGAMKVGKAQPTRMPLKPQRPSWPSSGYSPMIQPAKELAASPSREPQATCGAPAL